MNNFDITLNPRFKNSKNTNILERTMNSGFLSVCIVSAVFLLSAITLPNRASAADLTEIKQRGVLRHLGIPYANFVTGNGDGMSVELMQRFAKYLNVRYEYVKTGWGTVIEDLIGRKVSVIGDVVEFGAEVPIRGDLIDNGFTILPWRQKFVEFSIPTFPSQIWLIARADSKVKPIKPSGNIERDISAVRGVMKQRKVLALQKTCLDPSLYKLDSTGANVTCFKGNLNELAPAIINGEAEMTILDVPDALIALEKWQGEIKIIGPISPRQEMAVAFQKDAPQLRAAFNDFLRKSWKDGSYMKLVRKYYSTAPAYFPEFFKGK